MLAIRRCVFRRAKPELNRTDLKTALKQLTTLRDASATSMSPIPKILKISGKLRMLETIVFFFLKTLPNHRGWFSPDLCLDVLEPAIYTPHCARLHLPQARFFKQINECAYVSYVFPRFMWVVCGVGSPPGKCLLRWGWFRHTRNEFICSAKVALFFYGMLHFFTMLQPFECLGIVWYFV